MSKPIKSAIQTAIVENPAEFRKNISSQFSQLMREFPTGSPSDSPVGKPIDPTVGINLEKSVFNYAIQEAKRRKIIKKWENPLFFQLYMDRLRTIFSNLRIILPHILSNEITIQQLTNMTHQEMNPQRWFALIEQKVKRDALKYTTNIEASTDMFTCRKCRSKKCTYYELQTRSADEPASIFVTCLDCGKHWKQC
jgi:DNA-directed RNA polymerase subunit M/transcription elongation factor TFIIS